MFIRILAILKSDLKKYCVYAITPEVFSTSGNSNIATLFSLFKNSAIDFIINASSIGIDIIFAEEVYEEQTIVITYGFEEFAYLNLMDMTWVKDINYGFDLEELKVIYDVAKYLDDNKEYIMELMKLFK